MPDYIMRWVASRYGDADLHEELGILTAEIRARKAAETAVAERRHGRPAGAGQGTNGHTNGGNGDPTPKPAAAALTDEPPSDAREAPGPGAGPGLRDVRRHDAADRLVLHVLELREQHRLRLSLLNQTSSKRESPVVMTGLSLFGRSEPEGSACHRRLPARSSTVCKRSSARTEEQDQSEHRARTDSRIAPVEPGVDGGRLRELDDGYIGRGAAALGDVRVSGLRRSRLEASAASRVSGFRKSC